MQPESAKAQERASLWRDLREAVAGSTRDFTEGSLARALVVLSVPMVLEMSMESLFAVVDILWMAKLGAGALAAVALTETLLTLFYALAMGIGMAATAYVSRRTGEKDPEGAARGAAQAIGLALAVSAVLGAATGAAAPRLLELLGADAGVVETGTGYARWVLGGAFAPTLLIVNNACLRSAGDAAAAMRALWIGNLVNMALDPCLIFGLGPFPAMGVTGSGLGTFVGRSIGVGYQLWVLGGGSRRLRIRRSYLRVDRDALAAILPTSATGAAQWLIATSSWMGLVAIVTKFGSVAVAGYLIAIRVVIFSILPAWGMCNAAATLVGQNLGAGKPERAERSVWIAALANLAFLGAIGLTFMLTAPTLVGIFTDDPEVTAGGADCLRIVSYGYLFYAFGMVMVQAFNGAGDTRTPTVIHLVCYWLVQIPLAWTLAMSAGMGPSGVYFAIAISESLLAVVATVWFRRGTWKTKTI